MKMSRTGNKAHFCRAIIAFFLLSSLACAKVSVPVSVAPPTEAAGEIKPLSGDYISVDSKKRTLTVYISDRAVRVFDRVVFGSGGVGTKKKRGDDITPIGRFRIVSINPSKKFRYFIALDYPSLEYAKNGLKAGTINTETFEMMKTAFSAGKTAPQDTALGGHIGIHGLGKGNIEIHRRVDWTKGCIALDNHQIEELIHLLRPGMMVDIT